jgi:lipoprotein-anchoring transpeptidase ErfK/SrfK
LVANNDNPNLLQGVKIVHFVNKSKCLAILAVSCTVFSPVFGQNNVVQTTGQTSAQPQISKPPIDPVVRTLPATPSVTPKAPVRKTAKAVATDQLKPGQFMWGQDAEVPGALKIVVLLDVQRLYVFNDSKLVAFSTISSGKPGHETPPGIFPILQKEKDHKSSIYDDAPMPFMQRLTWDGVAMHAGHLPGRPASHGCIRLPARFAQSLFGITRTGQEVLVLRDADTPPPRPVAPKVVPAPAVPAPVIPAPIIPAPALPVEPEPGVPVAPVTTPVVK